MRAAAAQANDKGHRLGRIAGHAVRLDAADHQSPLLKCDLAAMREPGGVGGQEALEPAVDAFNAAGHRLPWLENRRVVVSPTSGGPTSDPAVTSHR